MFKCRQPARLLCYSSTTTATTTAKNSIQLKQIQLNEKHKHIRNWWSSFKCFVEMFVGMSVYMACRYRHGSYRRMWVSWKFIIPMDKRAKFVVHCTSLYYVCTLTLYCDWIKMVGIFGIGTCITTSFMIKLSMENRKRKYGSENTKCKWHVYVCAMCI